MPNEMSRNPVWRRLATEPVVHFFLIGALLFLAQRWVAGTPRTIIVTPGVRAAMARRFEDLHERKPTASELEAEVRNWKRDEALFRESLRERLDQDDPDVRAVLVGKMRARAELEVRDPEPSEAELSEWLNSHRSDYESPRTYDFEFIAFPKSEPTAPEKLEQFARKINEGTNPAMLGRPVIGGNLSVADIRERFDLELAERIPMLPLGAWARVESKDTLFLVQVKQLGGGLPSLEQIRPGVLADWKAAMRERAIERLLQRTVERYRFEEQP
ncbi:MAG TPA: peptidylprolyl isomerase [Polyangiaceae bacterium]|nr:peptidylprolyl isomerase [Polyangiaceae bacterium]